MAVDCLVDDEIHRICPRIVAATGSRSTAGLSEWHGGYLEWADTSATTTMRPRVLSEAHHETILLWWAVWCSLRPHCNSTDGALYNIPRGRFSDSEICEIRGVTAHRVGDISHSISTPLPLPRTVYPSRSRSRSSGSISSVSLHSATVTVQARAVRPAARWNTVTATALTQTAR